MFLEKKWEQLVKENNWWSNDEKVLVAVSAGVDSMALFHLFLSLPEFLRPTLLVAHVNHQLRDVSDEEALFVSDTCRKHGIPFYSTIWEEGLTIEGNIEQAAREFRYRFFEKIMEEERISILVTGHHQDDQVETVMMRLINGNRLDTLTGIQMSRSIESGNLIRPLLSIKKIELYDYMASQSFDFYEDASNQEKTYFRNRLRNNILPTLRQENPQFNEHLLQFREELAFSLSLIEATIRPLYQKCVNLSAESCQIDVGLWQSYSLEEQHFILNQLVRELEMTWQLVVSQQQQGLIGDTLLSRKPNQEISLKNGWFLKKEYGMALISRENTVTAPIMNQIVTLDLNHGVYLSKTEWLGFYEADLLQVPDAIKTWSKLEVETEYSAELVVRKKQSGDRLTINKKGQSKKISRYFIDEKIPLSQREKSWVVSDKNGYVKWLIPFRRSYLSILDETAKIHYKLVYYYVEDK